MSAFDEILVELRSRILSSPSAGYQQAMALLVNLDRPPTEGELIQAAAIFLVEAEKAKVQRTARR